MRMRMAVGATLLVSAVLGGCSSERRAPDLRADSSFMPDASARPNADGALGPDAASVDKQPIIDRPDATTRPHSDAGVEGGVIQPRPDGGPHDGPDGRPS